jgi:hypothetical protein
MDRLISTHEHHDRNRHCCLRSLCNRDNRIRCDVPGYPGLAPLPGSVNIRFTNNSAVPATTLLFAIESKGAVLKTIRDIGYYKKGPSISHTFPDDRENYDQQVEVAAVRFADGRTWTNSAVVVGGKLKKMGVDATH